MKVKGGIIEEISHSPSGQVVAHVVLDSGRIFRMPFGPQAQIEEIVRGVELEIADILKVQAHAQKLNQLVMASVGQVVAQQHVAPILPSPRLPWYRKLWVVLSWCLRRKK